MAGQPVVIKLGGAPSRDAATLASFSADLADLAAHDRSAGRDLTAALVHGGGAEVTELSSTLGLESRFEEGIRLTTPREMPVVDMVLCGLVNKRVVRSLCHHGLPAVGISGADGRLITGTPIESTGGTISRTGTPDLVDPGLVLSLWREGWLPVVASPGTSATGQALNMNADDVALALGKAVQAASIVFLSDVDGVLDSNGAVIPQIHSGAVAALVESGIVQGGMIAKIRSAVGALTAGVGNVVIGRFERNGDLSALIAGDRGTSIIGDKP